MVLLILSVLVDLFERSALSLFLGCFSMLVIILFRKNKLFRWVCLRVGIKGLGDLDQILFIVVFVGMAGLLWLSWWPLGRGCLSFQTLSAFHELN
jgi:hypothetical protein